MNIHSPLQTPSSSGEASGEESLSIPSPSHLPRSEAGNICFVVHPFKPPFGSYYESVYRPAIKKAGLSAVRADADFFGAGDIIEQIWRGIQEARVVVSELTGRNPNVFYELGIAHAMCKPIVLVSSSEDDIPFDLRHMRVLYYDLRDPYWGPNLVDSVAASIAHALRNPEQAMAHPTGRRALSVGTSAADPEAHLTVSERYDRLMEDYHRSLDPYLQGVFNNFLRERIERLRRSVAHEEIILDDKEDFIHFYVKTLQHYHGRNARFTATSLPSRSYFWDDFTLSAIGEFIKLGGEMTRIFVVDDESGRSLSTREVMAEQSARGVNVFTTHSRGLSRRLRSTFIMVEHDKRIAWEVRVQEGTADILDITITTKPSRIAELEIELSQIHKIPYSTAGFVP